MNDLTRRKLLGAVSAAAVAPVARAAAPNDRIHIGLIGTGGRCSYLARILRTMPEVQFTAMCDVYRDRVAALGDQLEPRAEILSDYRRLLDRKDVDAVVVGAPDHWHTQMTLDAVSAGKDVYCEKPVTHRLEEGDRLIQGVEASKRIVATGTQQRSWDHYILAKQFIDGGRLGQITSVQTWWFQNYAKHPPEAEINARDLDWKAWLGNAPDQPFTNLKYRRWRFFWDFGGGAFTDLMAHWIDAVQWILESPNPKVVSATGSTKMLTELQCPDTLSASIDYDRFNFTYYGTMVDSIEDGGIVFRGSNGVMQLTRDGFEIYREGVRATRMSDRPEAEVIVRSSGDGTISNLRNWLDCIHTRSLPNAHIRAGVQCARSAHLANQAMRERRTIAL